MNQRAFSRRYGRYAGDSIEAALTGEFDNVYFNGQPRNFKTFTTTPVLTDLKDGEVVLTDIAGVRKIVAKISGALFHVTLTAGA